MNLATSLQQGFYRWALRGKAPEPVPVILTRKRVFVLPTRFGLAYCGLLLVMLIGAINYNLSLAYALVFLLAGLGVVCIFHTFRNLARLRITPGRTPPTFAGDAAQFTLLLVNPDGRPRPAVRVNLPGQRPQRVDLGARDNCAVRLSLPAPRRGWLDMPRVRLATTYPLGMIRAWAYAAPALRCLVYPAPHQAPAPLTARPEEDSGSLGRSAGLEDFAGLRKHQAAEPLRHVAWKAAAQREQGPLLTKVFDGGQAQTLWLDYAALPPGSDVETRLSLLSRAVCDAAASGACWGLRLPTQTLAPASGDEHFHACLTALALYGS